MAARPFIIKTHVVKGQHIRNYPAATRNGDSDIQFLEVKQYIPFDNQQPQDGDVTIIATQGSSFPKELYEPLWEDLLAQCKQRSLRIRAIWAVDSSNHGASGVLNETTQGDDPSFFDYARDLLQVINEFREQMIQPIIGISHSMGCAALVELSCFHPRLFASLILFDPSIGADMLCMGPIFFHLASTKPDLWPSREAAEKFFRKSLRGWHPRVFDRWMEYGLRNTPTLLYPEPGQVTLRMPKAQEAWTYGRSFFNHTGPDYKMTKEDKILRPDADIVGGPFYRSEITSTYHKLPNLRQSVLFAFPERNPVPQSLLDAKVKHTGTGSGGRVEQVKIPKVTHLAPFEDPTACAKVAAEFLERDLKGWRERTEYERTHRDKKSVDMIRLSEEWIAAAKEFNRTGIVGVPGIPIVKRPKL